MMKPPKVVKEIELSQKVSVSAILTDFVMSKVSLQQVLVTMGNVWIFEGSVALTGLPIVTNEETCDQMVSGMICKYILDNYDKIKVDAIKHWAKKSKEAEDAEKRR